MVRNRSRQQLGVVSKETGSYRYLFRTGLLVALGQSSLRRILLEFKQKN